MSCRWERPVPSCLADTLTRGGSPTLQQPRKRRSLVSLTAALDQATTKKTKARAHYDLALFHDNNGREAQAIPHYRKALALGIGPDIEAEAFAWLASSLYKTGCRTEASLSAHQALSLADDSSLRQFLVRLLRRIDRAANKL